MIMFCTVNRLSLYNRVDVSEVASLLVVVKAIAHDEVIGDLHDGVFDVEGHLQLSGLDEERADMQRLRFIFPECGEHLLHGVARVHDVFHDDDGASLEILVDTDELFDLAHRGRTLVGGKLDKGDLARNVDEAHQVCCKDKRPVEDGKKQRVLALKVLVESISDVLHSA